MLNLNNVKRYSVKKRYSKVKTADFAKTPLRNASFRTFFSSLPHILKADDLHQVVSAIVAARKKKKGVIFMAGAHVIKCGLNPIVIELLKRKVITCVALNGACLIHDFELAFQGRTSEDVGANLKDGSFGMGRETADFINNAVNEGVCEGLGLGYALASRISKAQLPYKNLSLLYNAYKYKVPVCAHVAIGTDIIHQHPSFDAGLTAQGSLRDFHTLVEELITINNGGVALNVGSAVLLPEVFLKALNLARNLGHDVKNFVTANFDMVHHYRPSQNVVSRPVMAGGKGFYIIGHHEIMLPLLAQAVIEEL